MTDDDSDWRIFKTSDEAFAYLRYVGTLRDEDIDLAETALALALFFLPGLHIDRYRQHIKKLCEHAAQEYAARIRLQEPDTAQLRAAVLRKIIHDAHGYQGDAAQYDDLQNASLIRVIERRKGMPIALGILYMVIARTQGWDIDGLNFPGHFLVRLQYQGQRLILDPFQNGMEMDAAALRLLLKSVAGGAAELAHTYYEAVNNRAILLRLQNNLKSRLIENEDYAQAILVIETMEAFAPDEYRMLFDKAIIYMKLVQPQQAAEALRLYISRSPDPKERNYANDILQEILSALS